MAGIMTYQVKEPLGLDEIVLKHGVVRAKEVERPLKLDKIVDQADKSTDRLLANGDFVCRHGDQKSGAEGEYGTLDNVETVERPLHQALGPLENEHMVLESLSFARDGAVMLHCLVGDNGIGPDGFHFARLGGHVSSLPGTIFD